MEKIWTLITSFLVIGIGAYGGGIVTVPLMQHELVDLHHLLSMEEISKVIAIAQMTPGPIAVNGATFVGFRTAGIAGALGATLFVVLPGILALMAISSFRSRRGENFPFLRLRRGLRAGVLSLLLYAVWQYGRGVVQGPLELAIALGAFLLLTVFEGKIHPLMVILGAGAVGMLVFS